jgi:hypothetical protein
MGRAYEGGKGGGVLTEVRTPLEVSFLFRINRFKGLKIRDRAFLLL